METSQYHSRAGNTSRPSIQCSTVTMASATSPTQCIFDDQSAPLGYLSQAYNQSPPQLSSHPFTTPSCTPSPPSAALIGCPLTFANPQPRPFRTHTANASTPFPQSKRAHPVSTWRAFRLIGPTISAPKDSLTLRLLDMACRVIRRVRLRRFFFTG